MRTLPASLSLSRSVQKYLVHMEQQCSQNTCSVLHQITRGHHFADEYTDDVPVFFCFFIFQYMYRIDFKYPWTSSLRPSDPSNVDLISINIFPVPSSGPKIQNGRIFKGPVQYLKY